MTSSAPSDDVRDRDDASPRVTGGSFAVVALAFAVTMLGATLPTPMYSFWQKDFGFEVATVTVIFAMYAVGVLAALVVTGPWSDAVGRKPLLLAGLGLSLLSDVVFLLAGATWVLLLGRLVSGLSAGVYVGSGTAAVLEQAPDRWRKRAPLVATVANIGGLGVGPVVAAVLITLLPWPTRLSFAVHVVATIVLVVLTWRVPETVRPEPGARLRVQRPSVPSEARSTFVGASIVGFAGFAVLGLMTAVSPKLVAQAVPGAGPLLSVSVVGALMLASVLAQVLLTAVPVDTAADLGCALLAVGTALLAVALGRDSLPLMLVAAVVSGAGQGLSFSKGLAAVLAKVDGAQRAATMSAFFVVAYVAISLPVVGDGLASQRWGVQPAGVAFSVAVTVLAVVALVALLVDQRRSARS